VFTARYGLGLNIIKVNLVFEEAKYPVGQI